MAFCPTCEAVKALMMSRGFDAASASTVAHARPIRKVDRVAKRKVKRGASVASRKLSKALKEVNKKARKKNGDLKKGWNQSRIMKTAQKMTKRDCK